MELPPSCVEARPNKEKTVENGPQFYTDKEIARELRMSPSWVRGQRHKRAHGLEHYLDLEARYVGSCPRYVREEVEAFFASIKGDA
jgi:hypothetical protein